ncbi:MAG: undecaprenyl-diphosphate phosphatase [Eubacteriales bacterium]
MDFVEILKAVLFGIVEGVSEWLPISSTGHMILLNEFVTLNMSEEFFEVFLVVIQLGAIMAVVTLFFKQLWPFAKGEQYYLKKDTWVMWFKVLVACVPAAIIGVLFDDILEQYLYNYQTVATSLIVFGIAFILIENRNKGKEPKIISIGEITYKTALIIGIFQLIAAIFPGTSRSGATIIGALLIGVSRTVAAEFTFFLAIPVMFGASLLKLVKFGMVPSTDELVILLVGMVVAYIVSIVVIRFLMGYIKQHDFKVFGWYRIVLGFVVLGYFVLANFT